MNDFMMYCLSSEGQPKAIFGGYEEMVNWLKVVVGENNIIHTGKYDSSGNELIITGENCPVVPSMSVIRVPFYNVPVNVQRASNACEAMYMDI